MKLLQMLFQEKRRRWKEEFAECLHGISYVGAEELDFCRGRSHTHSSRPVPGCHISVTEITRAGGAITRSLIFLWSRLESYREASLRRSVRSEFSRVCSRVANLLLLPCACGVTLRAVIFPRPTACKMSGKDERTVHSRYSLVQHIFKRQYTYTYFQAVTDFRSLRDANCASSCLRINSLSH